MVDRDYISKNNSDFYDFVMTGEVSVCILDPEIYASLCSSDRVVKLSDALGYECGASEDGYGISLSSLAFYEEYSALKVLPEDSVLCILRQNYVGRNSKEQAYSQDRQMLRALIEFKKED